MSHACNFVHQVIIEANKCINWIKGKECEKEKKSQKGSWKKNIDIVKCANKKKKRTNFVIYFIFKIKYGIVCRSFDLHKFSLQYSLHTINLWARKKNVFFILFYLQKINIIDFSITNILSYFHCYFF